MNKASFQVLIEALDRCGIALSVFINEFPGKCVGCGAIGRVIHSLELQQDRRSHVLRKFCTQITKLVNNTSLAISLWKRSRDRGNNAFTAVANHQERLPQSPAFHIVE